MKVITAEEKETGLAKNEATLGSLDKISQIEIMNRSNSFLNKRIENKQSFVLFFARFNLKIIKRVDFQGAPFY